jgi:hypothetical protein
VRLVHFVMQRKQLLEIAKRVEHRTAAIDLPVTAVPVSKQATAPW